jgi:hypothetical protein
MCFIPTKWSRIIELILKQAILKQFLMAILMDSYRLEFDGAGRENRAGFIGSIGNSALFLTLILRVYPQLSR